MPHIDHLAKWSERNLRFGNQIAAAVRMRIPCDLVSTTKIAHWAYSQTESVGGLTWIRADQLAPLTSAWRAYLLQP
jgi:hypothetical protein